MASHGIKDRVAIIGMGCTRFVEHWDLGLDDLLIDAANDAYASAGIEKGAVDAYWLGTAQGVMSGITLARPLRSRTTQRAVTCLFPDTRAIMALGAGALTRPSLS